jgi:uncharacterized membrane protein
MSTLIILLLTFFISLALNRYVLDKKFKSERLGRFAMSTMMVFTGVAHFFKTSEMVAMMPQGLPFKVELVYATGVLEILAAIGLVLERYAKITSIALIVFFILILPANVIGSLNRVELGGMENGPLYLLFRIPLQILFIWWTYYFGVRSYQKIPARRSESLSHF